MKHTDENELNFDRTAGCLMGLAVGDVLGCPLEAMHPETIKDRYGRVREVLDIDPVDMPSTYYWRSPGVHTSVYALDYKTSRCS